MSHLPGHHKIGKKQKLASESVTILNTQYNINKSLIKYHVFLLVVLSIISKIVTIGFTIFFARSSIDYFDLRTYALKSMYLAGGKIPYLDFYHEYPIMSVFLNLISALPSILFDNASLVFSSFQLLMILFDIGTVICVYFIALKIYNERIAFISGIIYTLSLVAAYTTLTRFDSFAVFLLTFSVLLVLYHKEQGYLINALGFFTKVFPIITLPFSIIYLSKATSYKKQIKDAILFYLIPAVVSIVPFIFLIGWEKALKPYIFATGSGLTTEYANTFTFMVYSWIHDVFKLSIEFSTISNILYGTMIITITGLLFIAYKVKEIKPINFIVYITISLFVLISFTKFHSPQYFMWITPFFAILVADKIEKISVFFLSQLIAYIEFPILFGTFYTNVQYTGRTGSAQWSVALAFFTIEYIILFILLYICSSELRGDIKETIKYYFH